MFDFKAWEARMAAELTEFQSEVGHFLYAGERYASRERLEAAYDRAVKALDQRDADFITNQEG